MSEYAFSDDEDPATGDREDTADEAVSGEGVTDVPPTTAVRIPRTGWLVVPPYEPRNSAALIGSEFAANLANSINSLASYKPIVDTSWTRGLQPAIDTSWMRGLQPSIDTSWTRNLGFEWSKSPAVEALREAALEQARAVTTSLNLQSWGRHFRSPLLDPKAWLPTWTFPSPDELLREALPANLFDADVAYEPDRWMGWIEEGLVLAWVPDAATIELLADAETPQARRSVLSRRAAEVLGACEELLEQISATALTRFIEPARRAIAGVRAGYPELAQSYAASTLETVQLTMLGRGHYRKVKGEPDQELGFRERLHRAQLEFVFRSFENDIPSTFNRHASSHAVALGKQYSRLNALLAIAHLVSALWKYELDTRDAHR